MQNRKLIVPAAVPELEAAYFSLEFTGDLWRHSRMNTSSADRSFTRRRFIAAAGLALAAPAFVPASVLGRGGAVAPSERVVMGVVGWGMQGPGNTHEFLKLPDCQVVAACDLDQKHLDAAVNSINGKYGNQRLQGLPRFPRDMGRKDIDAVMLAVPIPGTRSPPMEAARNRRTFTARSPWPDDCRAAGDREGGPEEQARLAKRVPGSVPAAACAAPPRSFATGSSESCNASK